MVWNYYTICSIVHSHALMYTIHTYYTPAVAEVVLNSWAPWYVHSPPLSSAGERPVAAEVLRLFEKRGYWGGEEWVRGGRSTKI